MVQANSHNVFVGIESPREDRRLSDSIGLRLECRIRRSDVNTYRRLALIFLLVSIGHSPNSLMFAGQSQQNKNRAAVISANKDKAAKALFKQRCVKCHGADGRGETTEGEIAGAQDFTDSKWQERVADERLINSITYGRGQMPSFGKRLSKDQIKLLALYVRSFKG